MRFLLGAALAAFAISSAANAQTPVVNAQLHDDGYGDSNSGPGLMTCWYNTSGQLTGEDSAQPGVTAGPPTETGRGGNDAWEYTVVGADASACPQTLQN